MSSLDNTLLSLSSNEESVSSDFKDEEYVASPGASFIKTDFAKFLNFSNLDFFPKFEAPSVFFLASSKVFFNNLDFGLSTSSG